MNSGRWTLFAIAYQTLFAYAVSLIVFQLGKLFGGVFTLGTAAAIAVLLFLVFMVVRPSKYAAAKKSESAAA